MHRFVRSLISEWRKIKLPFSRGLCVVAVSGGADSCSLLTALSDLATSKKLDHVFIVAHINHCLRGAESDADEAFVRSLAAKFGFRYEGITVDIGPITAANLEERARKARYHFLRNLAEEEGAFAVLTAHTISDQAETLLMNLIRGSGPSGLGSMRPVSAFGPNEILLARPLLRWAKREDTESYCMERQIQYRRDEMNDDFRYTRVRIRKTLMPLLKTFNPQIVRSLARTASLFADTEVPSERATLPEEATLAVRDLKILRASDLNTTIRAWIRRVRGNLRSVSGTHIEAVANLALSPKSGRFVQLPGAGLVVKSGGKLSFTIGQVEKTPPEH
jgi:tRNA(Ile)-lysidine synthase